MKTKQLTMIFLALVLFAASAFATKDYMMTQYTAVSGGATGEGPTTTTPGGGAGGGGAGGGAGAIQTETILEKTLVGTISGEELAAILTEAGYSEEQAEAAKALQEKVEITQTVKVEKITGGAGGTVYRTTITITINNSSNMDWENVKVVVEVPKAVAASAEEITSPISFIALKADPIIEFTVNVPTGTTKTITWSVAKNISGSVLDTIKAPIVASLQEVPTDLCKKNNVNCDDGNPCTSDSCNPETGTCTHTNVADDTGCGPNMVCKSGQCTIKPTGEVTGGELLPLWAIVLIIIVIICAAYYFSKKKKQK